MKHQILNRWTSAVLFECELPDAQIQTINHLMSACEAKPSGCIVWQLSITSGAGRVFRNGKKEYAHRVMYSAVHGEIPSGLLVRHTCDNRACINPSHLVTGTHDQNMRDMVERGRSTKGRTRSIEHCMKLSIAGRGKHHPEKVKRTISASVRAYFESKVSS